MSRFSKKPVKIISVKDRNGRFTCVALSIPKPNCQHGYICPTCDGKSDDEAFIKEDTYSLYRRRYL